MLTAEQLERRKVGGSDVATILGLNPYKTAEELRLEILGVLPREEGGDAIDAGNFVEDGIRDFYAKKTGRIVRRSHQTIVRQEYPWLTAHVDGLIQGEKRGVEIKNVHWRMAPWWGEQGTDEIAEYYLPQVHTYMLVKNYPVWDVAAYFGGADLRIYTVERDTEMDEIIVEATHQFWYVNVLQNTPCDYVDHPSALKAIKRIYPGTDGTLIELPTEFEAWHAVRVQALEMAKKYEATADAAKAHILARMGNSAIAKLQDGTAYTRKLVKRKPYQVEEQEYIDFRHSKTAAKQATN